MSSFTAEGATKFFRSYEVKCDEELVQEWLDNRNTNSAELTENDVWEFTNWWIRKGTAYEEGIDDKTKIVRLLKEINDLKEELSSLRKEKEDLESQLGIMPF